MTTLRTPSRIDPGCARASPCRRMYSISPAYPRSSQRRRCATPSGVTAGAIPTASKPSSRARALIALETDMALACLPRLLLPEPQPHLGVGRRVQLAKQQARLNVAVVLVLIAMILDVL